MMTYIKSFFKPMVAIALIVALLLGSFVLFPMYPTEAGADIIMTATPTFEMLGINKGDTGRASDIDCAISGYAMTETTPKSIPMYTIIQSNGYGANYVKLRDVCYYLDMDVVWNANNPNAMYIYTKRHYLDAWEIPGAAKETKIATPSSMDIYVDDVKVQPDSNPVLIDNNNYFKIRDLAKLVDVACVYGAANLTDKDRTNDTSGILLDARFPYLGEVYNIDANGQPNGNKRIGYYLDEHHAESVRYTETNPKTWESSVWYGGDSGTLSDTPVTYSARDSWGKEDYWNSEENREYREYYETLGKSADETEKSRTCFNAIVQLMLDADLIASNTSGEDGTNPYYVYPKSRETGGGVNMSMVGYSTAILGLRPLPSTTILGGKLRDENVVRIDSIFKPIAEDDTMGWFTASSAQKHVTKVYRDAKDIIAKAQEFETDRERVTYLAHAVCDKLVYSGSPEYWALKNAGVEITSKASVELNGSTIWEDRDAVYSGVCMAYNDVFSALAAAANIPTTVYYCEVDGTAAMHCRTDVYLADEQTWVAVDCTWADGPLYYQTGTEYDDQWICFEAGLEYNNVGHAAIDYANRLAAK